MHCPPAKLEDLKDLLRLYDIQFSVDVEDVQKLVDMNPISKGGIVSN